MANQNFRVKNGLEVGNITIDAGSGIITATKFIGDGSSLTNLPSGGGTSDFVRTSTGIHTLGNIGIGTTVVTSVLNISSPAIGDTSNYVVTYGNFDIFAWGGIGTHSTKHFDFTTDGNNNTYVVGGFYDNYYTYDRQNAGGNNRPFRSFISKIDSSQNLVWDVSLSSSTEDYNKSSEVCGICSATNQDIVVAMKSYRYDGYNPNYFQEGLNQLSFVKIDTSGSIQWQTTIDNIYLNPGEYRTASLYDEMISQRRIFLTTDSSGNIYASGKSAAPFIIKLDSSGNILFSKILYNTNGPTQFVLKNNSLFWFGEVNVSAGVFGKRLRVVKFDLNGDIIWDKWFYTAKSSSIQNTKFNVDDNENIYFFTRIVDRLISASYGHGYVVEKYNSSLVREWSKRINTTVTGGDHAGDVFYGYPGAIGIDSNQNVYVVAPNNNEKSRHPFGYDIFKLDSSGSYVWKRFLSAPKLTYESFFSNQLLDVLCSKIEIKGTSLKFVGDVATPNMSKDILEGLEDYLSLSWIEKRNSDTISVLISNLNLDGDCIGLYGTYAVEELEITRNHAYLNIVSNDKTSEVVTDILNTSGISSNFYFVVSNVGIGSTVGVSTFTTGSIGLSTTTLLNLVGGINFQSQPVLNYENYPHLKSNTRNPFDLTVSGTTKLSKLIVEDIEFSSTGQSLHTIAIGYSSGFRKYNTDGRGREIDYDAKYNTFIGAYISPSLDASDAFQYNNFIGHRAGNYSSESCHNNFIGAFTGYYTRGCYNNFFGSCAGYANAWGECNVFIGCRAGSFAPGANSSVMIGSAAGGFGGGYGGYGQVFLGQYAGAYTSYNLTYTDYNTFIGSDAGRCGVGGCCNTFIGAYAGAYNVSGSYNNFFGHSAGYDNQTGNYNNFFGYCAGTNNTTGNSNVFIGRYSGCNNGTGSYNIFFGSYTGLSNRSSFKTIIGSSDGGYNNFFDSPYPEKDYQLAIGHQINGSDKYWIVGDEYYNIGIGTTSINSRLHVTANAFTNPGIGSETWIMQYGDIGVDTDNQEFKSVSYDSLGNIYTGGTTPAGSAFVIKTDPFGSIIWEKFFDHPDPDKNTHSTDAIFVDKETNDVYVAISVDSVVQSIILVKLNSSGDILWQREIDGLGTFEEATSISVSSADYVYVLGSEEDNLLLVAFNKSGTELWKRNIGGINLDLGWQVSSSASRVFVAGNAADTDTIDANGTYTGTNTAFLVYGFNSSGTEISSRTFRVIGDSTSGGDYELIGISIVQIFTYVDIVISGKSSQYGIIVSKYRDFLNGNVSVFATYSIAPLDLNQGDEIYGMTTNSNLNEIYITGVRSNRIYVTSLDDQLNINWAKEIECSNGDDILQGLYNCINLNSNDNRIVISGFRNKISTGEADGVLIQLPTDGLNVDGIYGTSNEFKIRKENYGRIPILGYLIDEDANLDYGISVGISTVAVSTSGIITATSSPSYTQVLYNFIPVSLYNDAATFDGNVVVNGGQLSFTNGASISGNLGIGTTNPTSKLTVGGDVKVGINTSQGIILTSPNGTAYRLVVDDSGNLSTSLV